MRVCAYLWASHRVCATLSLCVCLSRLLVLSLLSLVLSLLLSPLARRFLWLPQLRDVYAHSRAAVGERGMVHRRSSDAADSDAAVPEPPKRWRVQWMPMDPPYARVTDLSADAGTLRYATAM